jgi:hypothetical protein
MSHAQPREMPRKSGRPAKSLRQHLEDSTFSPARHWKLLAPAMQQAYLRGQNKKEKVAAVLALLDGSPDPTLVAQEQEAAVLAAWERLAEIRLRWNELDGLPPDEYSTRADEVDAEQAELWSELKQLWHVVGSGGAG